MIDFDATKMNKRGDNLPPNNCYKCDVPALAKGFERDTLVFSMLGVTGSIPKFRKPKNFRRGGLQSVKDQAP